MSVDPTKADYDALLSYQRNHPDASVAQRAWESLLRTIVRTPHPLDAVWGDTPYARLLLWLGQSTYVGRGSYGNVFLTHFDTHAPLAVKYTSNSLRLEYALSTAINILIHEERIPNFVYTYLHMRGPGPVFGSDKRVYLVPPPTTKQHVNYIVREYVPGVTFGDYMSSLRRDDDPTVVLSVLFQCVLAIRQAHKRCNGFTHWDLSSENVILVNLPEQRDLVYGDTTIRTSVLAKVIDYGTCTINSAAIPRRLRRARSLPDDLKRSTVTGGYAHTGFTGVSEPIHDALRLSLFILYKLKAHTRLCEVVRRTLLRLGVPRNFVFLTSTTLFGSYSVHTRSHTIDTFLKVLVEELRGDFAIDWYRHTTTSDAPARIPTFVLPHQGAHTDSLPSLMWSVETLATTTLYTEFDYHLKAFLASTVVAEGATHRHSGSDVQALITHCARVVSCAFALQRRGVRVGRTPLNTVTVWLRKARGAALMRTMEVYTFVSSIVALLD